MSAAEAALETAAVYGATVPEWLSRRGVYSEWLSRRERRALAEATAVLRHDATSDLRAEAMLNAFEASGSVAATMAATGESYASVRACLASVA